MISMRTICAAAENRKKFVKSQKTGLIVVGDPIKKGIKNGGDSKSNYQLVFTHYLKLFNVGSKQAKNS